MAQTTKMDTNKKVMLQSLEKALGVVTVASKDCGIARSTHYGWLLTDPDYAAEVESIGDIALDFAESQLHKQIKDGEVSSTIFYLKTKGKKRGYIERTDFGGELTIKQIKHTFDGSIKDLKTIEDEPLAD